MTAPTFGAVGTYATGGNTLNVPIPAGVVAGSKVIIAVFNNQAQPVTTPSGFTLMTSVSGSTNTLYVFHKTATGAESGNYVVSVAGTLNTSAGIAVRFEAVNKDPSPTSGVTSVAVTTASTATASPSAITEVPLDNMLLCVKALNTSTTCNIPTGWTRVSAATGQFVHLFSKEQTATGSSGVPSSTAGTSTTSLAVMTALKQRMGTVLVNGVQKNIKQISVIVNGVKKPAKIHQNVKGVKKSIV